MSLAYYDEYYDFIKEIMRKVPALPIELLIIALMNYFPELVPNSKLALFILREIQRNGHILLSSDGWAITKEMYLFYTNDKGRNYNVNSATRLGDKIAVFSERNPDEIVKEVSISDLISNKDKKVIDCLWIVFDLLPDSNDFVIGVDPWNVSFCTEYDDDPGTCYQIIRINNEFKDCYQDILRYLPKMTDFYERENTFRIAIVDTPEDASKVPYVGFRFICVLDNESETGYRIIENRETNVWADHGYND